MYCENASPCLPCQQKTGALANIGAVLARSFSLFQSNCVCLIRKFPRVLDWWIEMGQFLNTQCRLRLRRLFIQKGDPRSGIGPKPKDRNGRLRSGRWAIPVSRPRFWLCPARQAWPRFAPSRSAELCWSCPWPRGPSAGIRPRAFGGPGIWARNPPAAQQRGRSPFGSLRLQMWTSGPWLATPLIKFAGSVYRYRVPLV